MPTASQHRASFSVAATLEVAACVAIAGGVLLAAAESLAAVAVVSRHLGGEALPHALVVAGFGKAALSHTLVWLALLPLLALAHRAATHRRRVSRHGPLPFLVAAFVLFSGLLVVPADLALASRASGRLLVVGVAGVIVVAVAMYAITWWTFRRIGAARGRLLLRLLGVLCGLMTLAASIVFVRSPWYAAATFRAQVSGAGRAETTRPNLLWIVLDTVRPDRSSVYSDAFDTTPCLQEWSDGALVFEQAVSNGMWTVPSHASMFTGLSVRAHGADHRQLWLGEELSTVASVLREEGYATGLFSNNPFVSRDTNLAHGFDDCYLSYHLRHLSRFSLEYLWEKSGLPPFVPWFDGDFGAALTNELVATWLHRHGDTTQPFFVFVNYMEAHLPYRVPKCYRRLYLDEAQVARSYRLRRQEYGNIVTALDYRFNIEGRRFLLPADREVLKGQYLATLRYLDQRVAELLDIFRRRGLLEDTLVVIVSDHGEYLDTHGMWSHRFLAYDDLIRVMLMLREPGRSEGKRVATPVQLSDLYVTVLSKLLHRPQPPPGYDNADVFALAESPPTERIVIAECNGPSDETLAHIRRSDKVSILHRACAQIAVTDGRHKFMRSGDGVQELYDLAVDPGELNNLIEMQSHLVARLAAYVEKWQEAVAPRRSGRPGDVPELPPDLKRTLRSLGYVGGD